MPKDLFCLVEMKVNGYMIRKYILQSQLDLFIQENPQYEYIRVVPEKIKAKVRRKNNE